MPILLWDASAIAKRYVPENGSDTVDALFVSVPAKQMSLAITGYAETFSILLRQRNRRDISAATFDRAKSLLRKDVVLNSDFVLLSISDAAVYASLDLMERHNLNASDAAILANFLAHAEAAPPGDRAMIVVASDQRLLRAAQAEGLHILNPESLPAADVPAFLAAR